MKKNKNEESLYSMVKVDGKGLVPTETCLTESKIPLSIEDFSKGKKRSKIIEWAERHKVLRSIVAWIVVLAITIFAIVFVVHSCNNNSSKIEATTVPTTSASSNTQATATTATKPKATESTEPTTSKAKKKSSSATTTNNNSNSNEYSSYSNGNDNNSSFGKGGENSSYSSGSGVSKNYDTHEKDKDMSSEKDSKKDEGITGGNEGYGASISNKKVSPSPEKEFEEEHPLPPTISQEEIDNSPTVPLTPKSNDTEVVENAATTDNQAE